MNKESQSSKYIAYDGTEFTIEWYFDEREKSSARDYYTDLAVERKKKAMALFILMANAGKIGNIEKFRSEGDKIYAFKPVPDRFLCFFFAGSKIIITNAFEKKTDKLPVREKDRALTYRADYLSRIETGTYYEEE